MRATIRFGAVVGALLALLTLAPAAPAASAATYPCADGYVQVEDQAWWRNPGDPFDVGHVHQQLCWPTVIVNGPQTYRVNVLLHKQPPGARVTRVRISDGSNTIWSQTTGFPAIDANGNAAFSVDVKFDASKLSTGAHEMRLATYVRQPNSTSSSNDCSASGVVCEFVSSGRALYVRSFTGGTSRTYSEARGWYPRFEYLNSRTRTKLADLRELRAGETFHTQCVSPSGVDATLCGVRLDPNVHAGSWGTQILPWYPGETSRTATFPSGVAPGLHKVVIHAESTRNLGGVSNGTNSSSFVVTVLVP